MSALIVTAGCTGVESLPAERTEPAHIDVGTVRRIGVQPFTGPHGEQVARAVMERLRGAGFEPVWSDVGEATLHGAVELFEAFDAAAEHPARMRVRHHVVRDGRRAAAPPVSVTLSVEACQRAGQEAAWRAQLIEGVATRIVEGLSPQRRRVEVEWESAGDLTDAAQTLFRAGDYAAAERSLTEALAQAQRAGRSESDLAAIYYDLGLCYDLLGRADAAERSFDEALTLHGSERHIETLRAFRARTALSTRGGR